MNDQINNASGVATQLTSFIHANPILSLVIAIVLCSWMGTAAIKQFLAPGPTRRRKLVAIDIAIAAGLSALVLHDHFPWEIVVLLCLLFGFGSPFAYWIVGSLLCAWKPDLRKFMTLKELVPEPEPEAPASINSAHPPGDTR